MSNRYCWWKASRTLVSMILPFTLIPRHLSHSFIPATALVHRLMAKTSNPSSVPKRQRKSSPSSQVGSIRCIVSRYPGVGSFDANQQTTSAASDWPLFTLDGEDAATTTDGAACDPTGVTVTCKLSSSPAQPSTPSNQSATLRNPSAIPPDPSTILPNQSTAPPSEAAAPSDQSHVTPIIPDSTPHQVDPSPSTPSFVANQPGVADDRDSETPAQPNTDTDISSDSSGTAPPPSPVSRAVSAASVSSRSNLLAGVRDEPGWMQKKGTLNYFRNTFKLGNLADVIRHWYELERLLGFQKVVSIPVFFSNCAYHSRRPRLHQDSQQNGAQSWSICFTRMHTNMTRTLVSRPIPLAGKSWHGGPRFVLLVKNRMSGLGDQQGFPPSLSFSPGGALSLGSNPVVSETTASARSRMLIASSLRRSTTSRILLRPSPCCLPRLCPLVHSDASEQLLEGPRHRSDAELGKLGW